jgi:hypothetical protein
MLRSKIVSRDAEIRAADRRFSADRPVPGSDYEVAGRGASSGRRFFPVAAPAPPLARGTLVKSPFWKNAAIRFHFCRSTWRKKFGNFADCYVGAMGIFVYIVLIYMLPASAGWRRLG